MATPTPPTYSYNPTTDIPSQAGNVILITGANTGIGKATALELAKHDPAQLWIAARNISSGHAAVEEIKAVASSVDVRFVACDLTSFESVKEAARTVVQGSSRLDILMLNAGIVRPSLPSYPIHHKRLTNIAAAQMGGHPGVTAEGYEKQLGTNHMGHALLLKLLTPLLLSTAEKREEEPRIISFSSKGHAHTAALPPDGISFPTLKSVQLELSGVNKYTQSKLANVVYARQYAVHYPQLISVAIHPGEVLTELFNKGAEGGDKQIEYMAKVMAPKMCGSVEEGVKNGLWAATAAQGVQSGRYYEPVGVSGKGSELSKDEALGKKLWAWTEGELEAHVF
jgi:retinol dehydrogenase-12